MVSTSIVSIDLYTYIPVSCSPRSSVGSDVIRIRAAPLPKMIYTSMLNHAGATLSCVSSIDLVKPHYRDPALDKATPVHFRDEVHQA